MSIVTTVLFLVARKEEDGDVLQQIQEHLVDWGGIREVSSGPHNWAGNKAPQADAWAGAYNHWGFDLEKLMKFTAALSWIVPDAVLLCINREWDDGFSIYRLSKAKAPRWMRIHTSPES